MSFDFEVGFLHVILNSALSVLLAVNLCIALSLSENSFIGSIESTSTLLC